MRSIEEQQSESYQREQYENERTIEEANKYFAELQYRGELTDRAGIPLDCLEQICEAHKDERLIIRPDCRKCTHKFMYCGNDPCYNCIGQDSMNEKGYYFEEAKNEEH